MIPIWTKLPQNHYFMPYVYSWHMPTFFMQCNNVLQFVFNSLFLPYDDVLFAAFRTDMDTTILIVWIMHWKLLGLCTCISFVTNAIQYSHLSLNKNNLRNRYGNSISSSPKTGSNVAYSTQTYSTFYNKSWHHKAPPISCPIFENCRCHRV